MPRGDNPNSRANLIRPTSEQARELGKRGAKKSLETKRQRKTLREELLALLEQGDTQEKISLSLLKQAEKGNTKAFEIIRDTIGEKPVDKVAVATANEEAVNKLKDAIAKRRSDNG